MALLFADGFDLYSDLVDLGKSDWMVDGGVTFSTSAGKFGGGAFTIATPGNFAAIPFNVANGTTFYVGGWYRHDGTGGTNATMFRLMNRNRTFMVGANHNASGTPTINIGAASTLSVTGTTNAMTANTWYWVEFKVTTGTNSSTTNFEMRVDGAVVATATGVNGFDSNGCAMLGFSGKGEWDDIVVYDTTGSTMTAYTGALIIDALRADSAVAGNNWTGAYTDVDDLPSDDDSTYAYASVVGKKAGFGMTNLTVTPNTVYAVQARIRSKKDNAGVKQLRGYCLSGGTQANGVTVNVRDEYTWERAGIFTVDPKTSAAWTPAATSNMKIGVEVIA